MDSVALWETSTRYLAFGMGDAGFERRLSRLILTGYRKPLTSDDLWRLNPRDSSDVVVTRFTRTWRQIWTRTKRNRKVKKQTEDKDYTRNGIHITGKALSQRQEREPLLGKHHNQNGRQKKTLLDQNESVPVTTNRRSCCNLFTVLVKAFGWEGDNPASADVHLPRLGELRASSGPPALLVDTDHLLPSALSPGHDERVEDEDSPHVGRLQKVAATGHYRPEVDHCRGSCQSDGRGLSENTRCDQLHLHGLEYPATGETKHDISYTFIVWSIPLQVRQYMTSVTPSWSGISH
ncbi:multidrug resistance-associated protein 1 [Elysia marginata]|uniref:Multidrug resistance-associated protein 1 n=1 Tax=Elysia marginata TaxID=1093978 RepID=A0AAV4F0S9_9GAST|nr:multidrug resistance-associated protein 1 [Elysia marginata]